MPSGVRKTTSKKARKPLANIENADNALVVEVDALMSRMGGLSSAGILQALAGAGKDSAWFAAELTRMYEGTDENYYKEKILKMMAEFVKQHEGQKIVVDPLASASNDELRSLEMQAIASVNQLLEGGNGEQEVIDSGHAAKSLPAPERGHSNQGTRGKSKAKLRDAVSVSAAGKAKAVSPKQSRRKGVSRRKPKR